MGYRFPLNHNLTKRDPDYHQNLMVCSMCHLFVEFCAYQFSRFCVILLTNKQQTNSWVLSLRFNGHFPGEPGLAGVYWSKGWWKWWWQLDSWSYKTCKAPVKSSPPTNQHPVFLQTGCPSCCPTNSVKALRGKYITFHGLAYPKLT